MFYSFELEGLATSEWYRLGSLYANSVPPLPQKENTTDRAQVSDSNADVHTISLSFLFIGKKTY